MPGDNTIKKKVMSSPANNSFPPPQVQVAMGHIVSPSQPPAPASKYISIQYEFQQVQHKIVILGSQVTTLT